jgi:nicotinamide/nicotinate riboside kinase
VRNGIADWDCPEALDNDAFLSLLESLRSGAGAGDCIGPNRPLINPLDISDSVMQQLQGIAAQIIALQEPIVLVDGFLIYHSPCLVRAFDMRFFMRASFNTLKQRRLARTCYLTDAGTWQDPPNYFENVVWPSYLKYNIHVLENLDSEGSDYILLDTDNCSIEDNVLLAAKHILAILKQE